MAKKKEPPKKEYTPKAERVPPKGGSGTAPPKKKPKLDHKRISEVLGSIPGDTPVKTAGVSLGIPPPVVMNDVSRTSLPMPTKPTVTYACGHTRPAADFRGMPCPQCAKPRKPGEMGGKFTTLADTGRLPKGSSKMIGWNGEKWSGTLAVPGCPPFHLQSKSEFRCIHGLDRLYREYLMKQQVTVDGVTEPE